MTDVVEKLAEQIYKAKPVMVEGHALDWKNVLKVRRIVRVLIDSKLEKNIAG